MQHSSRCKCLRLFNHRIGGIAIKVDSRSIQSQDVTEEYIDVEARIKTKKYTNKIF
ncbi:MAG: DUF4349 domain-containing protein [Bacteroidetes bacterium]|nr:DUF4349 domain-containing protein [Bacteroidota bacterium]